MMREPPVARPPRAPQDFDINDAIREKLYDFNRAVRIIFSHNPRLALVYRGNTGKYMAIVTYYRDYPDLVSNGVYYNLSTKILTVQPYQVAALPPLDANVIGKHPKSIPIGKIRGRDNTYDVFYVADFSNGGIGLPADIFQGVVIAAQGFTNHVGPAWLGIQRWKG